jgi:hypothetical protein
MVYSKLQVICGKSSDKKKNSPIDNNYTVEKTKQHFRMAMNFPIYLKSIDHLEIYQLKFWASIVFFPELPG